MLVDAGEKLTKRLKVIGEKLERLRAEGWKKHQHQFCVESHRFLMGPRLTERSHPILLEAVEDAAPQVRATSLQAMAKAGNAFTSIVVQKLADSNAIVREAAVRTLSIQNRVEPFRRELNAALARETNASVLFTICHALEKVDGIDLTSLRPHIESTDVGLRQYAAHFFGKTTGFEKNRRFRTTPRG